MRRKDREITDFDEMMKIIAKCDTCRLALFDDEFPYIVPLNFGMDCEHNIILYDERMSCTMGYESVIGHGIVEFVEDENKIAALKILMRHYHEEDFKFNEKVAMMTEVFRVKVLDMTGKRRDNIHPEEKVKRHITLE